MTNVIEDNAALRNELKEAFKEVNKLQRLNLKKKQANDELKEKIELMKQEAIKSQNNTSEKKRPTSPRIQKANFDSEIPLSRQESTNTVSDEWQPMDLQSLKKIA